jgi:hypothetical protein
MALGSAAGGRPERLVHLFLSAASFRLFVTGRGWDFDVGRQRALASGKGQHLRPKPARLLGGSPQTATGVGSRPLPSHPPAGTAGGPVRGLRSRRRSGPRAGRQHEHRGAPRPRHPKCDPRSRPPLVPPRTVPAVDLVCPGRCLSRIRGKTCTYGNRGGWARGTARPSSVIGLPGQDLQAGTGVADGRPAGATLLSEVGACGRRVGPGASISEAAWWSSQRTRPVTTKGSSTCVPAGRFRRSETRDFAEAGERRFCGP